MSSQPEQTWDAELLNRLANEPRNQQLLGYTDIDLAPFFDRPGNVAIGNEDGVALFAYLGHGRFEGHYLFGPHLAGHELLEHARKIIDVLFTTTEATGILGQTPIEQRSARMFNRALGFAPAGTSTTPSGRICVNYKMERSQWEASLAVS